MGVSAHESGQDCSDVDWMVISVLAENPGKHRDATDLRAGTGHCSSHSEPYLSAEMGCSTQAWSPGPEITLSVRCEGGYWSRSVASSPIMLPRQGNSRVMASFICLFLAMELLLARATKRPQSRPRSEGYPRVWARHPFVRRV